MLFSKHEYNFPQTLLINGVPAARIQESCAWIRTYPAHIRESCAWIRTYIHDGNNEDEKGSQETSHLNVGHEMQLKKGQMITDHAFYPLPTCFHIHWNSLHNTHDITYSNLNKNKSISHFCFYQKKSKILVKKKIQQDYPISF